MAAQKYQPHPLVDHIIRGTPLPYYVVRHSVQFTHQLGYVKDIPQRMLDAYK